MSGISEAQRLALSSWAARNPKIRRVTLFGSRVKGPHRIDSDIDIAIELEPSEDSNSTLADWMHFSTAWKAEVSAMFPFKVDLQWSDSFGTTKTIEQGINEASDVVYDRES